MREPLRAFNSNLRVINILIACLLLVSCGGSSQLAPLQDRSTVISNKIDSHIVSQGETLFSIAWRYGIDYKKLAGYNQIPKPYRIYPGQKLSLKPTYTPAKTIAKASPSESSRSKPTAGVRSKTPTSTAITPSSAAVADSQPIWQWPHQGNVTKAYGSNIGVNQGIDIAGRLGESVLAAASGKVVYSGSGLRGYGNLLIIKHNDLYLSAYAHNSKLLVKEGAFVKAGQKIAEIGSSGTDKPKLHFEIRLDGTPVDPIKYLPWKAGVNK